MKCYLKIESEKRLKCVRARDFARTSKTAIYVSAKRVACLSALMVVVMMAIITIIMTALAIISAILA